MSATRTNEMTLPRGSGYWYQAIFYRAEENMPVTVVTPATEITRLDGRGPDCVVRLRDGRDVATFESFLKKGNQP